MGKGGEGGEEGLKKQVHLFVPTLTQTNKFEITKYNEAVHIMPY